MASPRNYSGGKGQHHGGQGFTPGCWKADRSSGKVAIPAGPQQPVDPQGLQAINDTDGRVRDPRTAENIAAKEAALAPRRWTPTSEDIEAALATKGLEDQP